MIDHHGVVKEGKLLDTRFDGWPVIRHLLVAVIKRAAQLQTPNTSPAKSKSEDETTSMHDSDVLHSAKTFCEQTPDDPSEGDGGEGEQPQLLALMSCFLSFFLSFFLFSIFIIDVFFIL